MVMAVRCGLRRDRREEVRGTWGELAMGHAWEAGQDGLT